MKSWYRIIKDVQTQNKTTVKNHILVFETDDKDVAKQVETFYKSLMPLDNSYHRNAG